MFLAAWSTYRLRRAVCYTSEFPESRKRHLQAIFILECFIALSSWSFTFSGCSWLNRDACCTLTTDRAWQRPCEWLAAAHHRGFAGRTHDHGTASLDHDCDAGSPRTLYQALSDGWLPRYHQRSKSHGAPTRAMWTDLSSLVGCSIGRGRRPKLLFIWLYRIVLYDIHFLISMPVGSIELFGRHCAAIRSYMALALGGPSLSLNAILWCGRESLNPGRWCRRVGEALHIAGVLLSSLRTG